MYNSTFCSHSVFMCFVWISEQTAIISLYSINFPGFKTEAESVYCSVRNGSLNQSDTVWYLKAQLQKKVQGKLKNSLSKKKTSLSILLLLILHWKRQWVSLSHPVYVQFHYDEPGTISTFYSCLSMSFKVHTILPPSKIFLAGYWIQSGILRRRAVKFSSPPQCGVQKSQFIPLDTQSTSMLGVKSTLF